MTLFEWFGSWEFWLLAVPMAVVVVWACWSERVEERRRERDERIRERRWRSVQCRRGAGGGVRG